MQLLISNIGTQVTEESLNAIFSTHGRVRSAQIVRDPAADSRTVAYIEMPDDAEARIAINKMNGRIINGRSISVQQARSEANRSGAYPHGN